MRVVIAGGGTGGHLFPALAVAEELRKSGSTVLFVGSTEGLEAKKVPQHNFDIEFLAKKRWGRRNIISRFLGIMALCGYIIRGLGILSRFGPDVVIGVGGYISAPVIFAAKLKGVPTILMEQNSIPGRANRLASKFARKICITFPSSSSFFKAKKTIFTGNPVREAILNVGKNLPQFNREFTVMCYGGSQGAKSINESLLASLRHLRDKSAKLCFIHITGDNMDSDVVRDIYKKEGFSAEVFEFVDDLAPLYARAHLVLSRAGAGSITELAVTARPAILVPYPFSADDHQKFNAEYVSENGGGIIIQDGELTGDRVAGEIRKFMDDPEKLALMNEAMWRIAKPNASKEIVKECFELAG